MSEVAPPREQCGTESSRWRMRRGFRAVRSAPAGGSFDRFQRPTGLEPKEERVGPILLIRDRAFGASEFGKDWRGRWRAGSQLALRQLKRSSHAVVLTIVPIVLMLASSTARHWIVEALATICVLGGFVAAPLLTVVAWIGFVLPDRVPLHHVSSTLFVVALLWLSVAVLGAHIHSSIHTDKPE